MEGVDGIMTTEEEQRKVSLHLNVDEMANGGSDSGVDVTPAVSCDSSLASGCYDPCKSPLGPFSPTIIETGGSGPSSLPCCYTVSSTVTCDGGGYRPSTPTWRRSPAATADRPPRLPNSMSSSFHFETNRSSPPRTEPERKRTDLNAAAKQSKISTVKKLVSTYDMAKSLDRYATLPRRRRSRSKENLTVATVSAGSGTPPPKEPSLNRAASLRRKHIEQGALAAQQNITNLSISSSPVNKPTLSKVATRPPPPPVAARTKIYHEVCSQTCLTNEDINKALSGCVLLPVENRVETYDAEIQVSRLHTNIMFNQPNRIL